MMNEKELNSMIRLLSFLTQNGVEFTQIADDEVVVPIPILSLNFTEEEQEKLPLKELSIADTMTMEELEENYDDRIESMSDFAPLHIRVRKNGGYDWTVYY